MANLNKCISDGEPPRLTRRSFLIGLAASASMQAMPTLAEGNLSKNSSYRTIGHEILDIEEKAGYKVNKSHYQLLDGLIDDAIDQIQKNTRQYFGISGCSREEVVKYFQTRDTSQYTEQEAHLILTSIDHALTENNFVFQRVQVFSDALSGRKLDKDIRNLFQNEGSYLNDGNSISIDLSKYAARLTEEELRLFLSGNSHRLSHISDHLSEVFHFIGCNDLTVGLYLSVADVLNLPMNAVQLPGHVFARFENKNWETVTAVPMTDKGYMDWRGLSSCDYAIEKGVYMRSLSREEAKGLKYYSLASDLYQKGKLEKENPEKAIEYYDRAIELNEKAMQANIKFVDAYTNKSGCLIAKAEALTGMKKISSASQCYTQAGEASKLALGLNPKDEIAIYNHEMSLRKRQEIDPFHL